MIIETAAPQFELRSIEMKHSGLSRLPFRVSVLPEYTLNFLAVRMIITHLNNAD